MRFAALLGTKDEADILPLAIEHLRRIGVELIVVLDARSTDETHAYLSEAEKAGDIWVLEDRFDAQRMGAERGLQATLAQGLDAEWVLLIDSDELPLPRGGSLHDLPDLQDVDILAVPRFNVVLGPDGPHLPAALSPERYDDVLVYAQPIPDFYRVMQREPSTAWIRGVLEPKTLVRAEAIATVQAGSHDVDAAAGASWRRGVARDLLLAHLPFRSLERFEMRSANVLAEVEADPEFFSGWTGWQWQRFASMAKEGRTAEEYERQVVDAGELAALRAERVVRSVAELYAQPIPEARSEADWLSMAARAEPWLTAAGIVSRLEDIPPVGKLEHVSGAGAFPAVRLTPDRVVKFYPRWRDGHEAWYREGSMLRLLERDGELAVPRLVADGELEPDLRYSVMSRVPGVALHRLDYELGEGERADVARWIGDFMRRLHAVRPDDATRVGGRERFEAVARSRYDDVERTALDHGLPVRLVEQLAGWLPPVDELTGTLDGGVICHGDLGLTSVMGQPVQPRFEPTGVVDLSHSFVGHPLADLGAVWWGLLARQRSLLGPFLEASVLHQRVPDFERLALAWVLMSPASGRTDAADVDGIADLDELAEHWFSGSPG